MTLADVGVTIIQLTKYLS